MKLTILQDYLKKGMNIVGRISPKSLTLPVLNNLLIEGEKNFLYLAATDLEIGAEWWSLAKVEKEGRTTVPIKILANFVNLLPNKPITFIAEDNFLAIESQSYKTKIKTLPSEDFPIIPSISGGKSLLINSQEFCLGLSQVVDIAQPSSARPEISGVYFNFQKDLLKMVATDSFRLGEKKLFPGKSFQEYSLILPQRTAREIINIFGEREGDLKIYLAPNQVAFEAQMLEIEHPQIRLVARVIEGEYPDYQAIVPKGYKTLVSLEKDEFLNQIKIAGLFSGRINEVKLKIGPEKEGVEITSQNPDLGEYRSFLPAKIKGEKVTVSFNHRFLVDGLLNIKEKEINLEINGDDGPTVLKPISDQSYLYIVMPVKTD